MIRKSFMILFLLQFLLPVFSLSAQDVTIEKTAAYAHLLESMGQGAKLMHAAPAMIAGFEEMIVRDGAGKDHIFYLSTDGKMAFSGSLLDVRHKKNITQASYKKFVAMEIAKAIKRQKKFFIPYRADGRHEKNKPLLYLFLGPDCPDCLHLWNKTLPDLSGKYDVYLSYGGLGSLSVKQVRKAMWGWCLQGDKRRAIVTNHPLNVNVETNDCKPGIEAFNRMKASFGRYIRHVPVAYDELGVEVSLSLP